MKKTKKTWDNSGKGPEQPGVCKTKRKLLNSKKGRRKGKGGSYCHSGGIFSRLPSVIGLAAIIALSWTRTVRDPLTLKKVNEAHGAFKGTIGSSRPKQRGYTTDEGRVDCYPKHKGHVNKSSNTNQTMPGHQIIPKKLF